MKICLDAGHYGKYNRSPGVKAYYESEMNWKLQQLLRQELENLGFTVLTTRQSIDENPELTARGRMAAGCDLFLSLHSNAVGSRMDETVDHPLAICQVDDGSLCAKLSRKAAEMLAMTVEMAMATEESAQVRSRLSRNDRNGDGLDNDNYYGVLHGARQVNVPGVILEHSFHTNTKTAKWLLEEKNLKLLARNEALAIQLILKSTPFEDVPWDAWYAEAVAWAWRQGIVAGRDEEHFDPHSPITRAEAVALLHRFAHEQ